MPPIKLFPLFNTDGSSTCPLGMPMNQNRLAIPVWSYAMEVLPPARIVELGSYNGGMTIALGLHAYHIGARVVSYERSKAPDQRYVKLAAFLGIEFRDRVDLYGNATPRSRRLSRAPARRSCCAMPATNRASSPFLRGISNPAM